METQAKSTTSRWLIPFAILAKSTKLLKVFKLFKFSKIILTFFTMALSTLVYSFMFGPWFAVGFVLMLFIHEMGHVMAMHIKGYKTSAPVFIPMLGAVIFAPPFKSQEDEAFIGYGGPFVGGLAALASFGLYMVLPEKSELLLLVSYSAAFLNLFNLIPLRPLDGGRVTQAVGTWFKWIGLVALALFTLYIRQPGLLLIWIITLPELGLPRTVTAMLGLGCLVTMTGLILLGQSSQGVFTDVFDIVLCSLFVLILLYQAVGRGNARGPVAVAPIAPRMPFGDRMKWLACYLLLAAGLVGLMAAQASHLPQSIKKQHADDTAQSP